MRRAVILMLALILGALLQTGCGYQFAGKGSDAPLALPQENRALYMKSVENPTLDTWLTPRVRAVLRDEITNRGLAHWVDKDEATAWVEVVIHSFTSETSVSDDSDQSLRFSASLSMTMTIRSNTTGKVLWSSGAVGYSESFYGLDEDQAKQTVIQRSVERMVDRMSQNY